MSTPDLTPTHQHAPGRVAAWLGEFVYVTDLLVLALVAAAAVIGGLNPLDSPVLVGVLVFSAVVLLGHRVWNAAHAEAPGAQHARQSDRERRGF